MVCLTMMLTIGAQGQSKWSSLNAGLSNPTGDFYQNNFTLPFDKAVGAKPGFFLAYQGAGYFNESKFKFGYTYVATFATNSVNWDSWVTGATSFSGTGFKSIELKLGFIGTYSVSSDLEIDGFIRFGDNIVWGGSGTWTVSTTTSTEYSPDDSFGIGYGGNYGVNARFRKFIGTFQYKTGTVKRDYYYSGGTASGTYNVPVTSFLLGVGILFTR